LKYIDFIGFTETWFKDSMDKNNFMLPNFNLACCDRKDGYGGVCLYYTKTFESIITIASNFNSCDLIFVKLKKRFGF